MNREKLTQLALHAVKEMKGIDIVVIDVRDMTSVTDTMIVCSGRANRHVNSIAERVFMDAKKAGFPPLSTQGDNTGWVVIDLCDVLVHVMTPEVRETYQLEKLWQSIERTQKPNED